MYKLCINELIIIIITALLGNFMSTHFLNMNSRAGGGTPASWEGKYQLFNIIIIVIGYVIKGI